MNAIQEQVEKSNILIEHHKFELDEFSSSIDLRIETHEQNQNAAELIKDIKRRYKFIEEERRSLSDPLFQAKKQIDELYSPVLKQYLEAERIIKKGLQEFAMKEEKKRSELELRLQLQQKMRKEEELLELNEKKKNSDSLVEAEKNIISRPLPTVKAHPKIEGISFRKIWKWRVFDPDAVPSAYKILDTAKLDKMVMLARNDQDRAVIDLVPGIEFYPEISTAVRV